MNHKVTNLTKFGVFIRKFRLDQGILLMDMAKSLGISPSYLSGIEIGNKPIPNNLGVKISQIYQLNSDYAAELMSSIDLSQQKITVKTKGNALDNQIVITFNRKKDLLTVEQKKQILAILEE